MARVIICLIIIPLSIFALLPAAKAGDLAERRIIGFSQDGRYFAFEQFGVQDGSGFPYADIFVLDTTRDSWAAPPVTIRIDNEQASLADARARAKSRSDRVLSKFAIAAPGVLLISRHPGEVDGPARAVSFKASAIDRRVGGASVKLGTFDLPGAKICRDIKAKTKGYSFSVETEANALRTHTRTIHRDRALPASRGCATGYGISDIIAHRPPGGATIFVALISMFKHGFEGPDRRFLALPFTLQ